MVRGIRYGLEYAEPQCPGHDAVVQWGRGPACDVPRIGGARVDVRVGFAVRIGLIEADAGRDSRRSRSRFVKLFGGSSENMLDRHVGLQNGVLCRLPSARTVAEAAGRFATMEKALASTTTSDDAQVGCNLTRDEGRRLDEYAREHELSRPNLCGLLVVRELKLKRLNGLVGSFDGSGTRKGAARVTARVSGATKIEFAQHVAGLPIGSDDAAAILFRAELVEQWLAEAVMGGNRA